MFLGYKLRYSLENYDRKKLNIYLKLLYIALAITFSVYIALKIGIKNNEINNYIYKLLLDINCVIVGQVLIIIGYILEPIITGYLNKNIFNFIKFIAALTLEIYLVQMINELYIIRLSNLITIFPIIICLALILIVAAAFILNKIGRYCSQLLDRFI